MDRPKKRTKPVGSGKKKGYKAPQTLEKLELDRQFKARIAAKIEPIADALLGRCLGVDHLLAQDGKTGQWVSVTDPKLMVRVMNGPEQYRRISAKDADVNAIREALNRLFGQAKQSIEVEDVTPVSEMTDAELEQELKRLAAAL